MNAFNKFVITKSAFKNFLVKAGGSSSGRTSDFGSEYRGSNPCPPALPGRTILTMFSVYILECADKSLYVGCTNDLEKRLIQHNNLKSGAHYTKIRRPVILKYSETFKTLAEARKREAEIKRLDRNKKLVLINAISVKL